MDKVLLRKGDLYNTWLKNICGVEEGCTEKGVILGGRLCRQWGFAEMGLCVECVRQKLHIFSSLQVHTTELRCISYPAQSLFYTSNVNSTHCSHCSAHPLLRNPRSTQHNVHITILCSSSAPCKLSAQPFLHKYASKQPLFYTTQSIHILFSTVLVLHHPVLHNCFSLIANTIRFYWR